MQPFSVSDNSQVNGTFLEWFAAGVSFTSDTWLAELRPSTFQQRPAESESEFLEVWVVDKRPLHESVVALDENLESLVTKDPIRNCPNIA